MTNAQWFALVGALRLFMGLTSSILQRSPLTAAIIYLAVGVLVGPTVFNLYHFNPLQQSGLLELLTEVAVLMILLLGGSLFKDSWSWQAVGLALFLFCIARPLSVTVCQLGTKIPWRVCGMTGWFGVRGIGSLYYLMYAVQHGLPESLALQLVQLTLSICCMASASNR